MSKSDIAVSVRGLSKSYTIAHQGEKYVTLAEQVLAKARRPFARAYKETFWALTEVEFDVKKGEVVGIIGRNGAGKSTLLKILSRITEPTAGTIDLYGRVGSLLEVGTGFHPELTGRENIFLNGAILGMTKTEIRKQFDAIVDFAGVERFLDTPVKRYSSGMGVRLAFSVAAHLRSEILIVDEVLAVGDADFQRKCLGKMQSFASDGRTVLFVSHSMSTISRLCTSAILLANGKSAYSGITLEATKRYMHEGVERPSARVWSNLERAPGDNIARIRAVRVLDHVWSPTDEIDTSHGCWIEVEYDYLGNDPTYKLTAVLHFVDEAGIVLFSTADFNNKIWSRQTRSPGRVRCQCHVPGNLLAEGQVFILVAICHYNPDVVHAIEGHAITFHVADRSGGSGARGECATAWPGVVRPLLNWKVGNVNQPFETSETVGERPL